MHKFSQEGAEERGGGVEGESDKRGSVSGWVKVKILDNVLVTFTLFIY